MKEFRPCGESVAWLVVWSFGVAGRNVEASCVWLEKYINLKENHGFVEKNNFEKKNRCPAFLSHSLLFLPGDGDRSSGKW